MSVTVTPTKRKSTTIEEIKGSPVPKSPRKITQNLTCAIVNKSDLRSTKTGKMFSMNLCDQSSKATLRAVCFNQRMFPNFEASKSYDISSFKIKKAFSDNDSIEILLDGDACVNSAATEVPVVACSNLKIKDILAQAKNAPRFINLVAKVMTIHNPREVGTFPDMKTKREISLADETGQIDLALWRKRAEKVDFKAGDVLSLQNVVVSTFQQQATVTTSFETSLSVIEKDIAVIEEAKELARTVQITATVLAIKNFQSVSKCLICKSAIVPQRSHAESLTIDCTTCGSSFLKAKGGFSNQCFVMLSDQNWYTARTSLSISIYFNLLTDRDLTNVRNIF